MLKITTKKTTFILFRIVYACIFLFIAGFVIHFNTDTPIFVTNIMVFGSLILSAFLLMYNSLFSTVPVAEQWNMSWSELLGFKRT